MKIEKIISRLKKVLRKVAPKAEAVFYSVDSEDPNAANIIYLLILLDQENITPEEEDNITTPIYDIEIDNEVIISIIVMTHKKWEAAKKMTMFYYNIMNKGIAI
jgi:uncharacterized protein